MPTYLGFDSSTQSLTVTAIEITETRREILLTRSLDFDDVLPHYGTVHGVLPGSDSRVAVSSPLMWAEALDRMMAEIASSGIVLADVAAISGSAQQHGSVYLAPGTPERLTALDPGHPLVAQLGGIFSRDVAPIWMDSSTTAECRGMEARIGAERLASLTGSRAFERFTGPQIRKFHRTDPDGHARTDRIHLVSSYLASLLIGLNAPLDAADASGMNLMDLGTLRWAPEALDATAPDLERRLPPIVPSSTVIGHLSEYWVRRYGFPRARVIAWSGDNPCSLIGTGLVAPGRWGISLGTSDTVFAYMPSPAAPPPGGGHVFASPTAAYMGITVFKNGSLARERIRDAFGLDWGGFSEALRRTKPGGAGILLPWFEPEITPPVSSPGIHRFDLDAADADANVRAVVESQMLAMARHSKWMGDRVDVIHATGGAAANREILQVMADVFGADVYQLAAGNAAALGAAIRAYHADQQGPGRELSWDEAIARFVVPAGPPVRANATHAKIYASMAARHASCEANALRER